jgi:Ca-activated chloride channel family protein
LRSLEKLQKEKRKAPTSESRQGDAGKGKDKGEVREGEDKRPSPEREKREGKSDPSPGPGKESRQKKGEGTEKTEKPEKGSTEDLSGELRPLQDIGDMEKKDEAPGPTGTGIDKKKAEALLDNVKENRSRFLRSVIPRERRRGVTSGKDW